jgi:hypothetical protein
MSFQPHYIASFENDSGLFTYMEPFLIPEKAFPVLEDAYCWRGRILRREGFELLGRLRRILKIVSIGNISDTDVVVHIFTRMGINTKQPLAQLQPGTVTNPLVITIGAPISQVLTDTTGTGTLSIAPAGVITAASINYNTGDLTLTFSGAAAASAATITGAYYPGLPVMGLRTREHPEVNNESVVEFDTIYAYQFNATTQQFEELPSTVAKTWNGVNSDFFWSTNYYYDTTTDKELFWASNDNMATATRDPIRYYNGTTWTDFAPAITTIITQTTLYNARIILPYKDRLLFLNTWEGKTADHIGLATNFPQRIRWSQNGNPLEVNAFYDDVVGKGAYAEIPTNEIIISAEFVKDTLLVKCERSSWKLVYTGNQTFPFVIQRINVELGSESTFSLVPFDRGVFSVGNVAITTDDSVNVERIDVQIPNTIFEFNNDNEGAKRVYGIRDYYNELVYWTYPDSAQNPTYPNKVLVFNYRNNTYATYTDSFTCYGYFQRAQDLTWAQLPYLSWNDWIKAWNSGVDQSLFPNVVAGNQHGFVEIVAQKTLNDSSLFIYGIDFTLPAPYFVVVFNVPNHNLQTGEIVQINNIIGGGTINPSSLNAKNYKVIRLDKDNIQLLYFNPITQQFVDIITAGLVDGGSLYFGNGVLSKFNNFNISTKIFAPFYEQGTQCRVGYVDYLIDTTDNGELTGTVYINEDNTDSLSDIVANPSLMGSNAILTKPESLTLIPMQGNQKKIWHRQFVQAIAQNFQIILSLSDIQNATQAIVSEEFVLHAMTFHLSPNARMTQ